MIIKRINNEFVAVSSKSGWSFPSSDYREKAVSLSLHLFVKIESKLFLNLIFAFNQNLTPPDYMWHYQIIFFK